MKLSNNDVIYLRDLGYTDTRSLKQIEKSSRADCLYPGRTKNIRETGY